MKSVTTLITTILMFKCFAQLPEGASTPQPDEVGKIVYNKKGKASPFVRGPGKGSVAIIDYQSRVPSEVVWKAIDYFRNMTKIVIVHTRGYGEWAITNAVPSLEKSKSEAAIFLVDDSSLPLTLAATGSKWGMVNVHEIFSDNPSASLIEKRFKKVFARGFGYAFGAGDANPMMGSMVPIKGSSVKDIDTIPDPSFTPQGNATIKNHLMLLGIYGERLATYRKACEEGWAPPPENERQKQIWDEVHAMPDKPITIEYDPKRDK